MGVTEKVGKSLRRSSDFDSGATKAVKLSRSGGKRKLSTKADAWDRLSSQTLDEQNAYRDVHGSQQLERGELGRKRGDRLPRIGAVVLGVLAALALWIVWGVGGALTGAVGNTTSHADKQQVAELEQAQRLGVPGYFTTGKTPAGSTCYMLMTQDGQRADRQCVAQSDLMEPQWHKDAYASALQRSGEPKAMVPVADTSLAGWVGFSHLGIMRILLTLVTGVGVWMIARVWLLRKLAGQNLMYDTADINQYEDDQHIAVPEEVIRTYGLFPDAGAHSFTAPSALIGHAMLSDKGTPKVKLLKRYEADIVSPDGDIEHYQNEVIYDENGEPEYDMVPMIDVDFGHELFDKSGLPRDKRLRRFFNPSTVPYNPGGENRDKHGKQDTVAQRIAEDWVLPEYEPQRPAGVYMVDEAPVNTMVLAMTRAGKGQTYIEPMIDMWMRERRQNNMVVNDPKGELLVKNYVRATQRGYQVVQFNLINALKTDIYNPLGMAAEAAREGNATACAMYVENIAEVFFPVDGGDDPVWPNAANNAFKRTAYGMIDFYLEEERQLRKRAASENWDPKILETRLDESWGKVTLYNCYQLFVQLSAKKLKNPVVKLADEVKAGKHGDIEADAEARAAYEAVYEEAQERVVLWDGADEVDMLTLFFNATAALPDSSIRTLVGNADKALRAIGGAEKMLASVYGIAITAMSFFADPTIYTLTSGTLSQNVDLGGLSFPRRFGVRFDQSYVRKYNLVGMQAIWECFADPGFTEQYEGGDFRHEDSVSREGWARAFFDGKFPKETAYLRLQLRNTGSGTLVRTFYFRFTKGYQTNLSGRMYVKDPILGEKLVKNGLLVEMVPEGAEGKLVPGWTEFDLERLNIDQLTLDEINSGSNDVIKRVQSRQRAIMTVQANYSEKARAIYLVTPPHLMKYAKIILILLKQLVDLNFDKSYMTKSSQKPLYKTRYMLDELGNLQSEGHGIAGLETMLSIGLGQEQQFTLILQTLQQLRDVYGDSVDKVIQGNTADIVFLKSTDDSMIETLQKMSGIKHEVRRDQKSITQDSEKVAFRTEGKVTYTVGVKEVPVISYNDLAYLPQRQSIVFSAGAPPVWNRNETILPMSFALFGGAPQNYKASNTICHPGHDYSLQTIPTLSSALEFDVQLNQPNFYEMVEKRVSQATQAPAAEAVFRSAYDYTDFDMTRLDKDVASSELMDINDVILARKMYMRAKDEHDKEMVTSIADELFGLDIPEPPPGDGDDYNSMDFGNGTLSPEQQEAMHRASAERIAREGTDNVEFLAEQKARESQINDAEVKKFARGKISASMLVDPVEGVVSALDADLAAVFDDPAVARALGRDDLFRLTDVGLYRRSDEEPLITKNTDTKAVGDLARESLNSDRVHMEEEPDPDSMNALTRWKIHGEFKRMLAMLPSWDRLADGLFEERMAAQMVYHEEN